MTLNSFSTLWSLDENDFLKMIAHEAMKSYTSSEGVEYPKLGLGVQGATTNDIVKWDSGVECYANWCKLFDEAKDLGMPLKIQMPLHCGVNG